jgi:hypothetical protein
VGLPEGQYGSGGPWRTRPCSRILAGSVPAADPLLAEISAFLARPEDDDDPGALERALTDGYARVLSLETDRVRLDKQITRLLTGIEDHDASASSRLRRLARERESRSGELARLRLALAELRGRYSLALKARR